jgi:hypothetical protein
MEQQRFPEQTDRDSIHRLRPSDGEQSIEQGRDRTLLYCPGNFTCAYCYLGGGGTGQTRNPAPCPRRRGDRRAAVESTHGRAAAAAEQVGAVRPIGTKARGTRHR